MRSQDSSGTASVTVRSWDALSRGVLGLRHYIPGYSPRTVRVTMTFQDSSGSARVTRTSWDTMLWGVVGMRDCTSQDSPVTDYIHYFRRVQKKLKKNASS